MTDRLSIGTCQQLLAIGSRTTMASYLKHLSLSGKELLTWDDLRSILELQVYLGLKRSNRKQDFRLIPRQDLDKMFADFGMDLNKKMLSIRATYYRTEKKNVPPIF